MSAGYNLPQEGKPVNVTGPGWDGWGVAYWGAAKMPSDPTAEHNTRKCWRWCHNEDPINSTVAMWKELEKQNA